MGVIYLTSPVHQKIDEVLHYLSHNISVSYNAEAHDYHTEYLAESHSRHHHESSSNVHQHKVLDFIKVIFDAASEKNNSKDNPWPIKIKIDKHFVSKYAVGNHHSTVIMSRDNIWTYRGELVKGYYPQFYVPPKQRLQG